MSRSLVAYAHGVEIGVNEFEATLWLGGFRNPHVIDP
jgi:ABC-type uncharacterized transport system YnjBCD permease subunit